MLESYQLTPVEYELMEILWTLGQGSVHDVMRKLPKNRQLAYTSVSTILRILQHKEFLAPEKKGRQHIYRPILTKQMYTVHTVKKIVNDVFSGSSANLVTYLVDQHQLSNDEINVIQALLNSKKTDISNA